MGESLGLFGTNGLWNEIQTYFWLEPRKDSDQNTGGFCYKSWKHSVANIYPRWILLRIGKVLMRIKRGESLRDSDENAGRIPILDCIGILKGFYW